MKKTLLGVLMMIVYPTVARRHHDQPSLLLDQRFDFRRLGGSFSSEGNWKHSLVTHTTYEKPSLRVRFMRTPDPTRVIVFPYLKLF